MQLIYLAENFKKLKGLVILVQKPWVQYWGREREREMQ